MFWMDIKEDGSPPFKVLVIPRPPVASLDYVLRQLVPDIPGPSWRNWQVNKDR